MDGKALDATMKTFSIAEAGRSLQVNCTTDDFDDYKDWMPFIDTTMTSFTESWPMRATFRAPASFRDEVAKTLRQKGYVEVLQPAFAKL